MGINVAVFLLAGAALVVAGCSAADVDEPPGRSLTSSRPAAAEGPYAVRSVIDGDTFRVRIDGRSRTVRVLGIDTPETGEGTRPRECFGREATSHARRLLDGARVWLESDPSQGRTDQYGRTLAYVWLDDRRMFNAEMVAGGYASEYTYNLPHRYQDEFRDAQRAAREEGRGLWGADTCAGNTRRSSRRGATAS